MFLFCRERAKEFGGRLVRSSAVGTSTANGADVHAVDQGDGEGLPTFDERSVATTSSELHKLPRGKQGTKSIKNRLKILLFSQIES